MHDNPGGCIPPTDQRAVADLRHGGHRIRVRHLRDPDAAADRAAGAARADGRRAGIARVPDVGRAAVLHPGIRRRHLRAARRLPDRPLRAPARAHLQHPHLRVRGVRVRVRRRRSRCCSSCAASCSSACASSSSPRSRGWPSCSPSRSAARRCSATRRRSRRSAGSWSRPPTACASRTRRACRRSPASASTIAGSARAVALHADVGRASRRIPLILIRPFLPESPALAAEEGRRHAQAAEHRRALRAGAAPDDDRHDDHVRDGLRRGVRRDPADPADRAGLPEVREMTQGCRRRRPRPTQEIGRGRHEGPGGRRARRPRHPRVPRRASSSAAGS